MKNDPDFVVVYSLDKLYLVEILKAYLEDNGIEAFILNQKDSSYNIGDVELLVKKEKEAEALELIKNFENNE